MNNVRKRVFKKDFLKLLEKHNIARLLYVICLDKRTLVLPNTILIPKLVEMCNKEKISMEKADGGGYSVWWR